MGSRRDSICWFTLLRSFRAVPPSTPISVRSYQFRRREQGQPAGHNSVGGERRREELHVPPHAEVDGQVRPIDVGAQIIRPDDPADPVLDSDADPGCEDKLLHVVRRGGVEQGDPVLQHEQLVSMW